MLANSLARGVTEEMKQRIRKLPRETRIGVHLRAALGEILNEMEELNGKN